MKSLSSFLKKTILLSLVSLSGCIATGKVPVAPPATVADLKAELSLTAQRLQGVVDLQHKQFNQQQSALADQLTTELMHMHEAISMLDRKINTLHTTTPATVVISDEMCPPPPPPGQTADGKLLVGETEWLWLDAAGQAFQARVDTGATTSSLCAADITIFERDGKDWARFFMSHGMDDRIQIEAPLVRHVRIKQASAEDIDRRPVVRLSVRIGELNEKTQFTLADRNHMSFPVLLGRDFLKDIAVVDVGRKFVQPTPLKDKP